jgi:hypothetical protein
LGYYYDDFMGCDSSLNSYFVYNADNFDGAANYGYGANPPMCNVTFLKGPLTDSADGLDNNHNNIIDEPNEPHGLSSFVFIYKSSASPTDDPFLPFQFYNYMRALKQDGDHITYGDDGYNTENAPTNYMFSGIPYSSGWTMDDYYTNVESRGVGSSGPFTFAPGESQTIDFAYIFTRDSLNPNGLTTSVAKNTADVQKIIAGFNSGNYPCLTVSLSENVALENPLTLYPNPATNILYANPSLQGKPFEVYRSNGQLIKAGIYNANGISLRGMSNELYLLRIIDNAKSFTGRFIKLKD